MRYLLHLVARTVGWVAPLTLAVAAAGCADLKVQRPASDATPPKLVWNVYDYDTGNQTDYGGSPTVNARRGQRFRVTLKALDPEGVKQIRVNPALGTGEINWQCATSAGGENLAQNVSATLGPLTQNLAANPDGTVLTSVFLLSDLDVGLPCQPNWRLVSGTARLTGDATNYAGAVTSSTIQFNVAP